MSRHKADVLALAASPDGSCVFAAGVDSQVALFQPVLNGGTAEGAEGAAGGGGGGGGAKQDPVAPAPGSWSYLDYKRAHTHDVRAMDVVSLPGGKSVLVSGGLDAQLVAYPVKGFLKVRRPPMLETRG